jgi:hypothetical protein
MSVRPFPYPTGIRAYAPQSCARLPVATPGGQAGRPGRGSDSDPAPGDPAGMKAGTGRLGHAVIVRDALPGELAGFRRLPDRDWSPRPGVTLLAYGLPLPVGR